MNLIHFSRIPIKELLHDRRDVIHKAAAYTGIPYEKIKQRTVVTSYFKPVGLWVSDEDSEYSWSWFCRTENFAQDSFKYSYEVKLKPKANILYLKTVQDIYKFTAKYHYRDSKINKFDGIFDSSHRNYIHEIDWPRVQQEYQGIVITPYQWDCRMPVETTWYYSWDCASGCIWDMDAIESFKENKDEVRSGRNAPKTKNSLIGEETV